MQVTLDTSQSLDSIVTVAGTGGAQTTINQFYSCNTWSPVDVGTEEVGCRRDVGQAAHQSVTLMYTEDINGTLPVPTPVTITVNIHGVPPNTAIVATDSMTASCN